MKKEFFLSVVLFLLITLIFFYPIFKGNIPFPGDLLVSTSPYNAYSYLGYAPGGVPNKAQGPDVMHELFPWKFFVIESLKQGEIPFWTPYNFSGNTMMANFQSATFYPLNILFFVLPFLSAWSVYIVLAPLLASCFTFLFLRSLQFSKYASLFGGVVFAFSSYMVVWMEYGNITHTLVWLPLALFFTEKYIQQGKWKNVLFLTITVWLGFLAGYIQGFFYFVSIMFVYFFVKVPVFRQKENRKKAIIFLAALIFPILLSLFQLLPTLALFSMSSRGSYTVQQITELLNPWWYSITTLAPDFFGNPASRNSWFYGTYIERVSFFGVIPFLFALVALFSPKKKEMKVFAVFFVISFLLSLDLFVTRYIFQLPIPILSTTVPTRILSIFVFCGAILSAYGLDLFLQEKNRKQFIITAFVSITMLFGIWGIVLVLSKNDPNFLIAKRNLILPTFFLLVFVGAILVRFLKQFKKIPYGVTILFVILFIGTVTDLFYFFHKITPFSPTAFVYPKTDVISYLQDNAGITRYWGYGSAFVDSNYQTYDKTFTTEGFDALHLKWYTEYISASKDGKVAEVVSRDNANIAPGYGSSDLRQNQYRQKALNLLGVKYILHKNETLGETGGYRPDTSIFDEKQYRLVWQKKPWQVYENISAAPRFFVTNNYRVITDPEKVIATLYSKSFDEKNEIVLKEDPGLAKSSLKEKNAILVDYQPNRVVIQTETDGNALLFLSDTYSPNWQATIDGKRTKVYLANYAFRAIVVPEGKHTITFFYKDSAFEIGLIASSITALVFVGFILALRKKNI